MKAIHRVVYQLPSFQRDLFRFRLSNVKTKNTLMSSRLHAFQNQIVNMTTAQSSEHATPEQWNSILNALRRKAALGCSVSQNRLGDCYRLGLGIEKNPELAAQCYKKAAMGGSIDAQYNLGMCFAKGKGFLKNNKKALKLLMVASDKGYAKAKAQLADRYSDGSGGLPKDGKKAYDLWKSAAEDRHLDSMWNLATIYERGLFGIEIDPDKAYLMIAKICVEKEDEDAFLRLGMYLKRGFGCEQNMEEAVKWFNKAVALEKPAAMYALARLHLKGPDDLRNEEKAMELMERAAKGKFAPAVEALRQSERDSPSKEFKYKKGKFKH